MKFSIVNIDKKKQLHLQVKLAEWFFERITSDTKTALIGNLRRHIEVLGDNGHYESNVPVPRELRETGVLRFGLFGRGDSVDERQEAVFGVEYVRRGKPFGELPEHPETPRT